MSNLAPCKRCKSTDPTQRTILQAPGARDRLRCTNCQPHGYFIAWIGEAPEPKAKRTRKPKEER